MDKHFLIRGMAALLVAGTGATGFAQDDEEKNGGERKVRIEITKKENGRTAHTTREFDLNDADQLRDALKDLGVMDELKVIGADGDMTFDMRRAPGALNDMSFALTVPDADEDEQPRPYLGVYYDDFSAADDEKSRHAQVRSGARVTGIDDGTPAEKAGLKEGDVITRLGEKRIANGEDLVDAINDHKAGDKVELTWYRGKEKKTAQVELAPHGTNRPGSSSWNGLPGADDRANEGSAFLGVVGEALGDDRRGVRITDVVAGSAAEKMGLKDGDVIKRINGDEVEDFADLADRISDMEPAQQVTVDIKRGGEHLSLNGALGSQADRSNDDDLRTPEIPEAPLPPGFSADLKRRIDSEVRNAMDNLRHEMDKLRHELRGGTDREEPAAAGDTRLSDEETASLKNKGVVGLDQPLDLGDLRCWPEEDAFHVRFNAGERGDLSLDLHDAKGERVYHETITSFKGNYEHVLDMSDKPTGTYFLVVAQNGKAVARKLLKE